jgi:hypothetical protein
VDVVMVGVVQLVEHQVVILGVAGSSPVTHPIEARKPAPSGVGFFVFPISHSHILSNTSVLQRITLL